MQTVVELIKDRLPITDVLSTYLTLEPSGNQYKAKCPFHSEKTASFSISPDRGLYYCFGCGARGDIFTFVQQFEGVEFKGALKILADRAGVVLTKENTTRESTDPLYELLEQTTKRYEAELAKHPEVLAYLTARGIQPETITAFRIGYVPDEWRYVATTMHSDAETAIAERAGLIKKTEKGYYDRFRNRIMFPLTDTSGRVVGFSGRLFPVATTEPKDTQSPKYLNSPETELFQKSRILFAFEKAKLAIRKHNFAILVEGQMDAVLAHQAGFKNTVATSGTAVSDMAAADPTANLVVLSRLTPNVFLAFDGDTAGQKALDRAAIVALGLGMNPKVVPLPEGIDPADFILAHGADAWKNLLKESKHFIMHQLRYIDKKTLSPHLLVRALKERLFPFLARVKSPVEQNLYIASISTELGISVAETTKEFEQFTASIPITNSSQSIETSTSSDTEDVVTISERLIALCSAYPNEQFDRILSSLRTLTFNEDAYELPMISADRMNVLLAIVERDYGALSEKDKLSLAEELAQKITNQFFLSLRARYTHALEEAEAKGDDVQIATLLATLQSLNQRRQNP